MGEHEFDPTRTYLRWDEEVQAFVAMTEAEVKAALAVKPTARIEDCRIGDLRVDGAGCV